MCRDFKLRVPFLRILKILSQFLTIRAVFIAAIWSVSNRPNSLADLHPKSWWKIFRLCRQNEAMAVGLRSAASSEENLVSSKTLSPGEEKV